MTISSATRRPSLSGRNRERRVRESGSPEPPAQSWLPTPPKSAAYANGQAGIICDVHADEVTNPGPSDALQATPPWDAPIARAREITKQLAMVYERTAEVLDHTAAVAEEIAERQARLGREQLAQDERRAAERARLAAQRARALAGERRAPTGQI